VIGGKWVYLLVEVGGGQAHEECDEAIEVCMVVPHEIVDENGDDLAHIACRKGG
jgi:hypothetical protein